MRVSLDGPLSAWAALVLAWPALAAAPPAADTGAELLRNPGFDADANGDGVPDGWSIQRDAALWREKVYLSGDYEVVSRPGAYVLATQGVALKPGTRYTLEMSVRGEGEALGGALLLHGREKATREMSIVWNVAPTTRHERCVATFTAPNPMCRLLLYNVARRGTIAYDNVTLREGEPDRPYIGTFTLKPIDRPIGSPVATPRIAWGTPLAGGPIVALFTVRDFRCSGDIVELTRRIDLDHDVIHTGQQNDACVSETGHRVNRRLDEGRYAVYVVPSRVPDSLAQTIRQRVTEGAGLIVIEGFGQATKFAPSPAWKPVGNDHPLRAGIPWELMPEKILRSIETTELGQGRAVRVRFPQDLARVWGVLPMESSMDAYKSRRFEYWEWWHSLLARALLWTARRDGSASLRLHAAAPDRITLAARGAPVGARARVTLRSAREIRFDRTLLRLAPREIAFGKDGTVAIDIPGDLPAGSVIADAVLLDPKGGALDWGSYVAEIPQRVRLGPLRTDRDRHRAAEQAIVAVPLDAGAGPVEVRVEARLIDAFGRVVSSADRTVAVAGAGGQSVECALEIREPLCVLHRAMVRALVDGREQDSAWIDIWVPETGPRRASADYVATAWAPGMTHPARLAGFASRIAGLGFNAEFASNPYAAAEHGMPCGGYMRPPGGVFRVEGHSGAAGVRPKCLSDPAVVTSYVARAREAALEHEPYGLVAVGITDEAFLTSRHQRDEVCFGPHCQRRYRRWLREQYGTLDALNAQWDTTHSTWDTITGARTEDVRVSPSALSSRDRARPVANYAPFVDFRTFMADVWVDACKTVTDAYHQGAPTTPVGHTNTFGADPFNGNDYWKLCTRTGFGWGQEYAECIKASGQKAIFELWRSFVETPEARRARAPGADPAAAAPFFNYGWVGYQHASAAAHYEPWWLALHGSRGVSWYAVNSMDPARGISWALVYPDLRLTAYSEAVKEALADLRDGCGKLLMEYTRRRPDVGILWSYPSMLVAWCESSGDEPEPTERSGADSYVTHYRSALCARQHVDELQLDTMYLAPEQISRHNDALDPYRVFLLPFTVATSPALVERLRTYVEGGGVVIGDLRCLATDERGRPHPDSASLERLFGVRREQPGAAQAGQEGPVRYGATKVEFTAAAAGIDLRGQSLATHGREAVRPAGATPLARHATGEPAAMIRALGAGFTLYLNFALPDFDPVTRELFDQIARRAGIVRAVRAENPGGAPPPRCYERNTFSRGTIDVHGFIRDHRRCEDSEPVRFVFDRQAHLYDVRARKYLGRATAAETVLPPGETALFACLPYRVTAVEASAPARIPAGADLSIRLAVRSGEATPGDHVLHIEWIDPDGRVAEHYARNALAPRGRIDMRIPLARNERTGTWIARVRDVLSGMQTETRFDVTTGDAE